MANNTDKEHNYELRRLGQYKVAAASFWTIAVFLAAAWIAKNHWQSSMALTRDYARGIFERDVIYRAWASKHGGVYAPVTEDTPPNPYLKVKERDIVTPSGKKLTLINPAYMTRQAHELAESTYGINSHITSLNPIRPQNAPDDWEVKALRAFERGVKEYSSIEVFKGEKHLRLMRPLETKEGCLKCHAEQGYKVGDIRGAISVSIPLSNVNNLLRRDITTAILVCILIWVLGVVVIHGAASRIRKGLRYRDEAAKKLTDSEEKHRVLFQGSRDAIMTLEPPTWLFTTGNPACVDMFEAEDEDDFTSHPPWELSPEFQPDGKPSSDKAREMIETAMREGSNFFEWTHKRLNGEEFPATVLLSRIEVGEKVFLQATVRDITEAKKANDQISLLAKEWQDTFDAIDAYVAIVDSNYRVVRANKAMLRDLGGEKILGEKCSVVVHGKEMRPSDCASCLSFITGRMGRAEVQESHLGNRWFDCFSYPIKNDDGEVTHVVHVFRDITAQKRMEDEKQALDNKLHEQQRMAAIGTLARGAAHEINNPINGIMNYAQLIKDKCVKGSDLEDYSGEIINESERIASIVRGLMSFSREEKSQPVSVEIKDVLNSAISPLRKLLEEGGIKVEMEIPEGLPEIICKPQGLKQLLTVFLHNAKDALNERYPEENENKIIRIVAGQVEKDGRQWLRVTVEDHGKGLASAMQDRIFEAFYTTKDRAVGAGAVGRGLGLATALNIAHEHHGSIDVESSEGEYTRFHLDLPLGSS